MWESGGARTGARVVSVWGIPLLWGPAERAELLTVRSVARRKRGRHDDGVPLSNTPCRYASNSRCALGSLNPQLCLQHHMSCGSPTADLIPAWLSVPADRPPGAFDRPTWTLSVGAWSRVALESFNPQKVSPADRVREEDAVQGRFLKGPQGHAAP